MQRKILGFMLASAALGEISAMDASRVQAQVYSGVATVVLMARLLETKGLMRTVPLAPQLGARCADVILVRELHGWQCALGLQIALQSDAADLELPVKRFLSRPARIRLPLLQGSGPNGCPKPKAHFHDLLVIGSKRTPGKAAASPPVSPFSGAVGPRTLREGAFHKPAGDGLGVPY